MALALYMDVHVPAAITAGLRRQGIDVLTSQEDGTREVDDEVLLHRSLEYGRLMFSQDSDLLRIAHDWQANDRHFAGLIYAHQQGPGIGQCVDDISLIAQCCTSDEVADRIYFLPL